jgi:hypothetical protein
VHRADALAGPEVASAAATRDLKFLLDAAPKHQLEFLSRSGDSKASNKRDKAVWCSRYRYLVLKVQADALNGYKNDSRMRLNVGLRVTRVVAGT